MESGRCSDINIFLTGLTCFLFMVSLDIRKPTLDLSVKIFSSVEGSMYHGKNIAKMFVNNKIHQQCYVKGQCMDNGTNMNHRFSAGQNETMDTSCLNWTELDDIGTWIAKTCASWL